MADPNSVCDYLADRGDLSKKPRVFQDPVNSTMRGDTSIKSGFLHFVSQHAEFYAQAASSSRTTEQGASHVLVPVLSTDSINSEWVLQLKGTIPTSELYTHDLRLAPSSASWVVRCLALHVSGSRERCGAR